MSRIANAAYGAEDIIESHIVDLIHAKSKTTRDGRQISSVDFYQGLQKVIEGMDLIQKEVMEIKDKTGIQHQQPKVITTPVVSSESHSTEQNNNMVGSDDVLKEVMDKLTGQPSQRQIIPISGMGGIGKSTLARNVYTSPPIQHHFDVRAWVIISQEYNTREILLEVLCQENQGDKETLSGKSEQDLGLQLHQSLLGRRYLVVLDDIWDVEAWDKIKFFFPENNNGSRIVVTTRLAKLAADLGGILGFEMSFLNEDKSCDLLCRTVFGGKSWPPELEEIGNEIAKNCKGLPLSIVVVGGLLAKSKPTREYWEFMAENLNSVVNLDEDERCLKILYTSYNQLPIHLKPCFLYIGAFPEDSKIPISQIIRLWVAEGFLKPVSGNSLEESAMEYLTDLIDRNLIMVNTDEWSGKLISCNIHDLLRDLCLREAEKENFLYVSNQHSLNRGIDSPRRMVIPQSSFEEEIDREVIRALKTCSLARSLICHVKGGFPLRGFKLLRVLQSPRTWGASFSIANISQLVNSRYLDVTADWNPYSRFPSSICLLWNLQTIIAKGVYNKAIAPSEFWKMPLLRHVNFVSLRLPIPSRRKMGKQDDDIVMENLQTLSSIENLKLSEDVVKRIPNIKKLGISYESIYDPEVASHYCLNNLSRLHKLESLTCSFNPDCMPTRSDLLPHLSFLRQLKKLDLADTGLHWEDLSTNIGPLPLLQVLKLYRAFKGPQWETVEDQFPSLKYLKIEYVDLEYWIVESNHFPRLEHLVLKELWSLEEIPVGIGEIPTLQSIQLCNCTHSIIISAKQILEEQEEIGNEGLQVQVTTNNEHSGFSVYTL